MDGLRIYADYNGIRRRERGSGRYVIPLDTLGSLRDLTNAGVRLREGLPLTVCDASDEEEDLVAEATARWDAAAGVWLAELSEAGYAYVPRGDRTPDHRFLCLGCRRDLGPLPPGSQGGAPPVAACPACGTPITAATAPPEAAGEPR
jgi:hypothetical protein